MDKEYGKTAVAPVSFDFAASREGGLPVQLTLSQKDVLGIVQSALDELNAGDPELNAVKRDVLDAVSEGKLADALRTAIIGAGQCYRADRN